MMSARSARSPRLQELAVSLAGSQRVVLACLDEIFADAHAYRPCWAQAAASRW